MAVKGWINAGPKRFHRIHQDPNWQSGGGDDQ
jgi:hypothetical protein